MKVVPVPRVMILPGDTPIYQVKIEAKRQNMRPTIDPVNMVWVLRPLLRIVK